ncbi:MAG: hypothetical protein AAF531_26840 [Actinomycetota bacterium]
MTTHPNGATASSAADLPTVSDDRRLAVAAGAAAGIVGGLAFGAAMLQLGLLPSIALVVFC